MKLIHIAGYVLVALVSARAFYSTAFKYDYEDSIKKGYGPEEKRLRYANRFGLYFAWMGLLWPIAWPAFFILWFVTRPTGIEKDIEKRKAEEARQTAERIAVEEHERRVALDMQRIRAWHEANKMEAPDTMTLRLMAEERVKNNEDIN